MKRHFKPRLASLLTVVMILGCSLGAWSQTSSSQQFGFQTGQDSVVQAYRALKKQIRSRQRIDKHRDNWGRPIRFNIVKLDVPNWCFGEPNLGYERKVSHHVTLMLHAAYFAKNYAQTDLSLEESLSEWFIHRAFYPAQAVRAGYNTRSRTLKFVPEVRGYIGRNAPRGVFIGCYYFFNRINWKVSVDFTDSTGAPQTGRSWSKLTMHGPGLVWGFQSIVLSRVSLGFEMGGAWMIGRKTVWMPLTPMPPETGTPYLIGGKLQLRLNAQLGYCFGL